MRNSDGGSHIRICLLHFVGYECGTNLFGFFFSLCILCIIGLTLSLTGQNTIDVVTGPKKAAFLASIISDQIIPCSYCYTNTIFKY